MTQTIQDDELLSGELPDSQWPSVTLPDVVARIIDNRGRTAPVASSGIPLIATDCIKEDALYPVRQNLRYVSRETYETWFRGHPEPGDVILVNKGTPGRVCQVPALVDFCIAQDMVALRPKLGVVDSDYLLAALRSSDFKEQVESLHVGTMIPHLKKTDFHHLKVPLPPLPIQQAIGRIYCDLSRKLELNRQMNRTLEDLAAALFRSWFIDFDPVEAKAAGRTPFGLTPKVAALFPAGFTDSELGSIPFGWRVGTIGNIAYNPRRQITPSEVAPDMAYIGLEHMPRKSICLMDTGTAADVSSGKSRFTKGEILFGRLRPYFHKVGIAPCDGVCSTDVLVITPRVETWFGLLLGHVSSTEFIDFTEAASGGTRMPRTSWHDMQGYRIALPPEPIAQELTEHYRRAARMFAHCREEALTLTSLRDTLLPRLLSGELRVKDAEKPVVVVA